MFQAALIIAASGFNFISIAAAQTVQEIRIHWETSVPSAPAPDARAPAPVSTNVLTLRDRRTVAGRLPKQRTPELSSDQLVIMARSAKGELLDWQLIPDPRIIRAEQAGPSGELSGRVFRRISTDILVALPNDPNIKSIEMRHPRWTGAEFMLDLIGTVPLN